jgi:DNA-binding FadR family transcriptional regulator
VLDGRRRRDEFLEADKQLHMAIAATTQNPIYQSVLASIHDNIHRYYDRFLSMDDPELQENYRDLCDLVDAIARADVKAARRLAREHVKRFNGYMQRRAREELNAVKSSPRRSPPAPKGDLRRR